MIYTFQITGNPPMCKVYSNGTIIDQSGPWESVESAQTWAEAYTNKLNSGIIKPEEPS